MDLRQLHYLVTVAEEGGFRRAARRLHVAQPPLSTAIKQLERELGVILLERSTRGVTATPAGREMVDRAREILDQVEAARLAVSAGRGMRHVIRVGLLAGPLCAGELTGPIFQGVREALPGHTILNQELSFSNQLAPLLNGDVDLAIVRAPLAHSDIELVPIAEEPRVLVVGSGHELAQEVELSVEDVLDVPMLGLSAPEDWTSFWQMNDLRGSPLICTDAGPVDSVNATQMALMTTRAATTIAQSTPRLAYSPDIHSIRLRGATPTVLSLAYRRGDGRIDIKKFIGAAARAAADNIQLLPGGRVAV